MKFWQGLTFLPTQEYFQLVNCIEDAGFTGVILSDHLVTYDTQSEKYPYRESGMVFWTEDTHWPDPWVTISALAQRTTTLQFTTAVYILPLRDPYTVAKSLSTLAVLSNNRVALGAGIGWQKAEFDMLGQNFHNRGERANEALDIIRKITSGATVEHDGKFYSFPPLRMMPHPTRPLPIYIGGESTPALQRAATQDGWIGRQYTLNEMEEKIKKLNKIRSEQGLQNKDFEIFIGLEGVPSKDTFKRMEDLGVTSIMTSSWPRGQDKHTNLSTDDKRRYIEEFAEKFIA